ncbi:MAG TPA: hypothetical protein PKG54_07340 [Phycisphaerae bacterium]|jgi:hypothetical protein|nr:hypothetical protein [Phycisphaerae bacterium]HOB74324.1 hypothetical protein [Phycisphaerae bacterium]HOJ53085.1 hypothetical protein [Phycisphaerae bacterium]HOL24822.1 hypothetical protein [Phycisphaerae bacterium]HPP19358.1 hypothetical protein [Phycisphaerae bacterium]
MRYAFANQYSKHWPAAAFGGKAAGSGVAEAPALPKQIRKRHPARLVFGGRASCPPLIQRAIVILERISGGDGQRLVRGVSILHA